MTNKDAIIITLLNTNSSYHDQVRRELNPLHSLTRMEYYNNWIRNQYLEITAPIVVATKSAKLN